MVGLQIQKKNASDEEAHAVREQNHATSDDYHLINASKIGTALFMTNARRALMWL